MEDQGVGPRVRGKIRALAQEFETYWRGLTEAETKATEWLQAEGAKSCGGHNHGNGKPVSFGVAVLVWIAMVITAVIFAAWVYAVFIRPLLRWLL